MKRCGKSEKKRIVTSGATQLQDENGKIYQIGELIKSGGQEVLVTLIMPLSKYQRFIMIKLIKLII